MRKATNIDLAGGMGSTGEAAGTGTDGDPGYSGNAARTAPNAAPNGARRPHGPVAGASFGMGDPGAQGLYNASVSGSRRPPAPSLKGGTEDAEECGKTRAIGAVG